MLAKLIYLIGTKRKINFGEHVFNQTIRHAYALAIKLQIAFPCLIIGMILHRYPDILRPKEAPSKKPSPLSFDYKLFVGSHVPHIVIPKGKEIAGTSGSLSKATRDGVLEELIEVSKILGETIKVRTTRKIHVDNLIKSMTQEEVEDEEANEEETGNEQTVPETEEN
jgi:hypothetical protein